MYMKSKRTLPLRYYLLLAILYPFIPAQAQKAHFGMKAGVVFSNISFKAAEPIAETDKKASGTFGVFVHIPVKGRFSLRPSVEYVSKGAFATEYFLTYPNRRKIQLSYFDIPVNLLYAIPLKKNKFIAGGGPVVSFLLSTKYSERGYDSYDLGVNVLAGYEWAIGASLCLNFTQGLKNVVANKTNGGKIQNYCYGFTIGYWF
jgi:hypothetical protein